MVASPVRRLRALALLCVAGLLLGPRPAAAEGTAPLPRLSGLTLAQAIERLHALGLEVAFSEALVRPEMRVLAQPESEEPRVALAEMLAPHGLAVRAGPAGKLVIVRSEALSAPAIRGIVRDSREGEPLAGVEVKVAGRDDLVARTDRQGRFEIAGVPAGSCSLIASVAGFAPFRLDGVRAGGAGGEVEIELSLALTSVDELIVTPSMISVSREEPAARLTLTTEELGRLPVIGDDPLRAAERLPGTAGSDFSARINVRGGHDDELLVLLDGLELFEPYHLQEFQSAFSIVPPETVGRLDLITGGFPASYGDRLSGVLDMTTIEPANGLRGMLSVGTLDAQAAGSGTFAGDDGSWIASGRVSMLPYAARIAEVAEDPGYFDLLTKLGYRLSSRQMLRAQWLLAQDDLRFTIDREDLQRAVDTEYRSAYGWVSHEVALGRTLLETIASIGQIDRHRNGAQTEPLRSYEVRDPRRLDSRGLQQNGFLQGSPRHTFKWGASLRSLEADYDYFSAVRLVVPPAGETLTRFSGSFRGRQAALFVSDRFRPLEALTFELGARWDQNDILEETHLSPRLGVAWNAGRRSVVRLAWGHYYQSQRAYELQVADGETDFAIDERAEQSVVAFEHFFDRGLDLRVELYRRGISRPRARWENLLDPVSSFPEVEADRVRIAPESGRARGLELLLRHRGGRYDLWGGYAYSEIDDRIDGVRVPRAVDQTHSLTGSLSVRLGESWDLSAGWTLHTGWPTTAVLGLEREPGGGRWVPRFGPIRGERLGDYRRVDLRVKRRWQLGRGELTAFADVLNALNEENARGVELVFDGELEEDLEPVLEGKSWLGRLMTVGVRWRF